MKVLPRRARRQAMKANHLKKAFGALALSCLVFFVLAVVSASTARAQDRHHERVETDSNDSSSNNRSSDDSRSSSSSSESHSSSDSGSSSSSSSSNSSSSSSSDSGSSSSGEGRSHGGHRHHDRPDHGRTGTTGGNPDGSHGRR